MSGSLVPSMVKDLQQVFKNSSLIKKMDANNNILNLTVRFVEILQVSAFVKYSYSILKKLLKKQEGVKGNVIVFVASKSIGKEFMEEMEETYYLDSETKEEEK